MREGWVELSLGELTENTRPICYGVLKPGPQVEGGVPLVKITDMDRRILGPEGMQQISNELDNEFRRSRLQGGEVLLSIQGTVGRVAIAASTLEGANISRTIAVIDPDDRLHNFYLMYVLEKIATEGDFDSAGSTRESLNISTIRSMKILCPPIPEQKRIVDLIYSVDSYIEALQQQLESAKKSRNAVLHELLTAGGNDWVETTLDGIAEYINGYPFKPADLGEVGLPVIRIKQLLDSNEPVDRTEIATPERCLLRDGDIVFSWSGTLAVRIWSRGPAKLNQHLFRVVEKKDVYKGIIPLILDHAIEELEEKSHGTTMKHITKQTLLPHKVLLPPLAEQKRIVEIMSLADEVVNKTDFAINHAKNLRSGLLSDLLSGDHEIPVSYDKVIGAA
jgi:type I restriction enzyme S subunit